VLSHHEGVLMYLPQLNEHRLTLRSREG
jgi:hypothetical protein